MNDRYRGRASLASIESEQAKIDAYVYMKSPPQLQRSPDIEEIKAAGTPLAA